MLRFSPAPTADMHIGTLRVAIINYLLSQQRKERFTVRIEDLDKAENIEGKDTEIMQILEKFALIHDSVFHQSEHLHMHQTFAIKLLEEDKAFICTCTSKEIEAEKQQARAEGKPYRYSGRCEHRDKSEHKVLKDTATPFVLRLKKPKKTIIIKDKIKGEILTTPEEVDAFIILRTDGTPSYNFACACDDMLSGVGFILREETYLAHTPKQIHIKTQLGYEDKTDYAHLPILLHTDTHDTDEDTSTVKWLFAQGFIPDAIINYLLLLGYNNTPKEVFTLPEAITWFDLDNLSNTSVEFDIEKLRFINRAHLRLMEDKQLSTLFGFADPDVGKLVKLYLDEASTINELALKIRPIFAPKSFEGAWETQMRSMQEIIANAPMISKYEAFETYMLEKSGLKDTNFELPLRRLLTGADTGPALSDIYPFIKSYLLEVAS